MIPVLFEKRLSAFYTSWTLNKQRLWGNSDAVVIHAPPLSPDSSAVKYPNQESSAFFLWLFGEELHDIAVIFTPSNMYFLCSQTNFPRLRACCSIATWVLKFPTSVQLMAKNDDGFSLIDDTIRNARVIRNKKANLDYPFVVGHIAGEFPKSKLLCSCINGLEPTKYQWATVNSGLAALFNTDQQPSIGHSQCWDGEMLSKSVPVDSLCSNLIVVGDKSKAKRQRDVMPNKSEGKRKREDSLFWIQGDQSGLVAESLEESKALWEKEKSNMRCKFEQINLSVEEKENVLKDNGQASSSTIERSILPWMEKLNLCPSFGSNEDKLRVGDENNDHLLKFEENKLHEKEVCHERKPMENGQASSTTERSILPGMEKLNLSPSFSSNEDKLRVGNGNNDQLPKFEGNKLHEKEVCHEPKPMEKKKGRTNLLLEERLNALFSSWRIHKEDLWGNVNVLVITSPRLRQFETPSCSISSRFFVWLFDGEFPDTTIVFTDTGIDFLCTRENLIRLRTIGIRVTVFAKVPVSVQLKEKDDDGLAWLSSTLRQVSAQKFRANRFPLVVGYIEGESPNIEVLSNSKSFRGTYVNSGLSKLLGQENEDTSKDFESLVNQGSNSLLGNPAKDTDELQTLREQYLQMLSLTNSSSAETANVMQLDKNKPVVKEYIAYLPSTSEEKKPMFEKKGDIEGNLPNKLEEKKISLEKEIAYMTTLIIKDGAEDKLLAEEQNIPCNLKESKCLLGNDGLDQSMPFMDARSTPMIDAKSDDLGGSLRNDSIVLDDWMLIERENEGQQTEVADKVSWKRWIMDKTVGSFGLPDKVTDETSLKE